METPQNSTSDGSQEASENSLLANIIEASKGRESTENTSQNNLASSSTGTDQMLVKKREPISMGTFLKLIGSILFVVIVFFGSFLAYITLNPNEALFFINIFSIDPKDIAKLLAKLINGSFGTMMLVTSIAWITSLFRAIWTPKDMKRKKLLNWLTAGSIGIILFLIL
jgi:hypothetical protein